MASVKKVFLTTALNEALTFFTGMRRIVSPSSTFGPPVGISIRLYIIGVEIVAYKVRIMPLFRGVEFHVRRGGVDGIRARVPRGYLPIRL